MSATLTNALLIALVGTTSAHNDHGSSGMKCPGSPAGFHAWLAIEASMEGSCANAREEVLARVAGQSDNTWDDPHGNGKYTLVSNEDAGVTVDRLSSNERYTDRVLFTFVEDGSVCKIMGCSESQGGSGGDQSTNLCNSWNLVCTKEQECCAVLHDFTSFTYTEHSKSSGAGQNVDVCLGGSGGSGGGFGGERQTQCLTAGPDGDSNAATPTATPTAAPEATDAPEQEATAAPDGESNAAASTVTPTEAAVVTGAPEQQATATTQQLSKSVVSHAIGIGWWIGAVSLLLL